ncbi:MAG: ATP-binding protein, partial [Chloroflexota bacterium]|nr:ATP-binding protein [Chloroflexota bacterium]
AGDLALAEAIAERAAAAIEHARLHEDRRRGELLQATIAALAREVGGTLEPGDVARRLAASLHRHFAYSLVGVFLIDRDRREVVLRGFASHSRQHRSEDGSWRLPPGRGIVGWVAERDEALLVPDVTADPRYVAFEDAEPPASRSELAVPIPGEDGPLGVINLESERPDAFDHADLYAVRLVARQAAVVLENALLHEQLVESAGDLRAVLENVEQGVVMTDPAGRIRFVNRRIAELFALDLDARDLIGRRKLEVAERVIAPQLRDAQGFVRRLAWLYAHPEETATDEVPLSRPAPRLLERFSRPLRDPEDGAVVGRIEVYTDVTEARRLERAKDEFLATASHELKTPITTLGGYLELLQHQIERPQGLDPARVRRYVGTARGELQRLRQLTDDLLEVARIQAGRLTLHPAPADLAAVVRETVERFARHPGLRERGHRIIYHADEPLPGAYDTLRLGQVFTNLLENALKYSPAGGEIVVEARRAGDEAVISVRDHGIGVPAEERERLFLPFYRAANASAGSPEGLGLGLYISRGIVEGHAGRIWVESAPDGDAGGSVFRVALPLGEWSGEAADRGSARPAQRPLPRPLALTERRAQHME